MFCLTSPRRLKSMDINVCQTGMAGTLDAISTIDADKILATFFFYCDSAGPTLCPFSTNMSSALDIFNRFQVMISYLNSTHATQQDWENATAIDTALTLCYKQRTIP